VTQVFYGAKNIIQRALNCYYLLEFSYDVCTDLDGPSMFVIPGHPITKGYIDMKNRGIHIRFI
jgi:hypothetical protein